MREELNWSQTIDRQQKETKCAEIDSRAKQCSLFAIIQKYICASSIYFLRFTSFTIGQS